MQVRSKTSDPKVRALGGLIQQHWKKLLRLRDRLRFSEETFHLILAGVVGVIGGVANLAYFFALEYLTGFIFRRQGDLIDVAEKLNPWIRLVIPGLGGAAAGLVLYYGLRLIGSQGPTNILEVVVAGDGRLPMRSGLVKTVSSLLSIATGASIGREGLITQLSATLASKLGQLAKWQPYRLRLLVACGAASGMAAAYNAPVTGAVFAAHIVLGNFSMTFFAPLVFASVVATMISRSAFGLDPLYEVPPFHFRTLSQLPWFLVLGAFCGVLAAAFMKLLRFSEESFNKLSWPIFARLALAGLGVGLLAFVYPEVWGNGYGANNRILDLARRVDVQGAAAVGQVAAWFLIGLFAAKLLATVITVGSGTVGGLITPTLFLGAGLGSLFGLALHGLNWASAPVTVFTLVGMGSVLAATIHSPLLAMIMLFEISLDYSLMPPLMLACVVASLVARRLHPDSVYTEPLRQKGVEVGRDSQNVGEATQRTIGELMREPVTPLRETASFREIADRFLTCSNNFLPVVDAQRRLLGIVALHDLKEYLSAGAELSSVIAYDIMRSPPPCLTPNQKLLDAVPLLLRSELRNVPVVNSQKEYRLVGAVQRAEALGFLTEAISARHSSP